MRWTTKNVGVGITNVNNWVDRIYLSQDDSLSKNFIVEGIACSDTNHYTSIDNGDTSLGTYRINSGYLMAGANYTRSVNVRIPERIFGLFYILVSTDIYNQVYEHTSEDDNLGSQMVR